MFDISFFLLKWQRRTIWNVNILVSMILAPMSFYEHITIDKAKYKA